MFFFLLSTGAAWVYFCIFNLTVSLDVLSPYVLFPAPWPHPWLPGVRISGSWSWRIRLCHTHSQSLCKYGCSTEHRCASSSLAKSHAWLHSSPGHVSTVSLWCLSGQAPGLIIYQTGNCSEYSVVHTWAFLGFLHMETTFREEELICTDLLPQYEAEMHTQTWQLGSTPASVI